MKKLLVLLAVAVLLPVGAMAAPADDLKMAADYAKSGNREAATPLLEGLIGNTDTPVRIKAQAHFVFSAMEVESDPAASVPHLDRAIAADPSFVQAYVRKAEKLYAAAKYAEAAEAAAAALEKDPDNGKMLLCRAESCYKAGDYSSAAEAFSACLKADNRNGRLYLLRGHCYLLSRQQDKALTDFTTALRYTTQLSEQEQNDVYYYRGMAYQDTDRFDLATGAFKKALEMNPTPDRKTELEWLIADAADKKALYEASAHIRKELEKAKAFIQRRNYNPAVPILQKILELPNVPDELKGETYYLLSSITSNPEEALALCNKAAELTPLNVPMLNLLGRLRHIAEDFPGAIDAYTQLLTQDSTHVAATIFRGKSNLRLGNWAVAEQDFSKVLERQAENYVCLTNRARAYFMLGNMDQARADIQRVTPHVSGLQKSDMAEYHYAYGLLAQHDKKYAEALTSYETALRSDSSGVRGEDMQKRKSQLESLRRWAQ